MNFWTEEREAELRKLWKEGRSAREIGNAFGVGRGCITGKVRRLGLQARIARINPLQVARRQEAIKTGAMPPKPPPPAPFAVMTLAEANAAGLRTPLMDLQSGMCRWPVNDDRNHLFCGQQWMGEHGPYCAHHRAYAYTSAPKKAKRQRRERGWAVYLEAA